MTDKTNDLLAPAPAPAPGPAQSRRKPAMLGMGEPECDECGGALDDSGFCPECDIGDDEFEIDI